MSEVTITANKAFSHLRKYKSRFVIEYGGAGSGKSYAIAQFIILSCLQDGRRKFLCIRKVQRTLRFSVYALFEEIIQNNNLSQYFTFNKSEMNISCYTGSKIICEGMDNPDKIKSIVGVTDIWEEEGNELSYDDHKQLNLRMRGGHLPKRIIISLNPVSQLSWVFEHFFQKPKDNVIIHHTTYRDNKFLDDAYKQELENLKDIDQYFYKVYTLGEWGVLGNLIFHNYVIEDFNIKIEDEYFGADFGFNHPSVLLRAGLYDGELYVLDELYLRQRTNQELRQAGEFWDPDYRWHIYTGDSAEPDRIKEFNDNGWFMEGAQKGKDSVKHGIDFLRRYKIHIHKTNCPNLASEMQTYKYRETRDGQVLDEPVPINDDCISALRYAVEPLWRNTSRWRPVA